MDDCTTTKACRKCGTSYPATPEYFHRDKNAKDGLVNSCKTCACKKAQEWRVDNLDYAQAYDRERYQRDYDKVRERQADYRERNRDAILAQKRAYSLSAHGKKTQRAWVIANADRLRERKRAEYARHHLAYKVRARNRKRRVKVAGGKHTADDVLIQYRSQRGKCWHCGKPVGDDYHVDHLIPLARGGTNDARNIVISCPKCNMSRGAKLPQEWNGKLF